MSGFSFSLLTQVGARGWHVDARSSFHIADKVLPPYNLGLHHLGFGVIPVITVLCIDVSCWLSRVEEKKKDIPWGSYA